MGSTVAFSSVGAPAAEQPKNEQRTTDGFDQESQRIELVASRLQSRFLSVCRPFAIEGASERTMKFFAW